MKAIVTGMIATYPVGGVVFDYAQYALALERLGFDVYYLEDTALPCFDPLRGEYVENSEYSVAFLESSINRLSSNLGKRWHFRDALGQEHGIGSDDFSQIVSESDVFINTSGGTLLRDSYLNARRKILIDTDPGWNHFVNYPRWDANPGWEGSHGFRAHDHFFTYAGNIGASDCLLPSLGLDWIPTDPPVMMDLWQAEPPGDCWTTVLTWKNFRDPIAHEGQLYGTKEMEFDKVEELPVRVSAPFEMAIGGAAAPVDRWRELGWRVVDSVERSLTPDAYQHYVQSSRGEFSVAKNVYVATRSGWFSCRSVCYLAAGLPVVVQDTGFASRLPCGEGLLAFTDLDSAAAAIACVESDYERHCRAARKVAAERFDGERIVSKMLEQIGL